jgi:hypothetical protein
MYLQLVLDYPPSLYLKPLFTKTFIKQIYLKAMMFSPSCHYMRPRLQLLALFKYIDFEEDDNIGCKDV